MSQHIVWYQPQRVVYQYYSGTVTAEDLRQGNLAAAELVRQGRPPVHNLVNALAVTRGPLSLKLLQESTSFSREPNLGWTVIVVNDAMYQFLSSMLGQFAGVRYHLVTSEADAIKALQHLDDTLKDLDSLPKPPLPE